MPGNEKYKLEDFQKVTVAQYAVAYSFNEIASAHTGVKELLLKDLTLDLIFLALCAQKAVYTPVA